MSDTTAHRTDEPASKHWGAIVVKVLGLLATVAIGNQWLLIWFTHVGHRELWQVAVYFGYFVVQVGAVGFVAGRFVPGVWSWVVFGWSLVLVDLLTFCMVVSYAGGWGATGMMLGNALVSGQVGAIFVWGVLGEHRWSIRLPIAGALSAVLLSLWKVIVREITYVDWFALLCLQSVLLCALCVILRGRGCRLSLTTASGDKHISTATERRWQFNLKEVFLQTTTLAVVMGVFRATVSSNYFSRGNTFYGNLAEIGLASLLAIAMCVALWTVFGERRWMIRLPAAVAAVSAIGIMIVWGCRELDLWISRQSVNYWDSMWFVRPKEWWLPWICLATGFLVATLWIFRAKGYRLLRVTRTGDAGRGSSR